MTGAGYARWLLEHEARALLTRLARVKPFALHEPLVPAASFSTGARTGIERYLSLGRRELRRRVRDYIAWLRGPAGARATAEEAQRRFTFLRLRFNAVLSHFDLFADVLTQRSEHETGVWLAGLDVVASDALALPGDYYEAPPLICYLDRGHGAAIRRARTRLPGGGENPVGIVRVPRERMVGAGVASSLVHEVGHQGAALLDLVPSLRPLLRGLGAGGGGSRLAWALWDRWISEIVADLWSVARVGVSSTLGLMGVVSLPRAFVFRGGDADPHPIPWVRVLLSAAMGNALYPHPQWERLSATWRSYYPVGDDLPASKRCLLRALEDGMPSFVQLLVHHRPAALRGDSLAEALDVAGRQPARLTAAWNAWGGSFQRMRQEPPSYVLAALGQAKVDGHLTPEEESRLLAHLLTYWAMRRSLHGDAPTTARAGRPFLALAS